MRTIRAATFPSACCGSCQHTCFATTKTTGSSAGAIAAETLQWPTGESVEAGTSQSLATGDQSPPRGPHRSTAQPVNGPLAVCAGVLQAARSRIA